MGEARTDDFIRQIYASPHNPTTEDFATILGTVFVRGVSPSWLTFFLSGFIEPPPETTLFANLDEVDKLIGTCHLVSPIFTHVLRSALNVIKHSCANYA